MQRLPFKTLIMLLSLTLYEVGLCSGSESSWQESSGQEDLDVASLRHKDLNAPVVSEAEVFEITYKVKARGFKVGKLESTIEKNGDHFKLETHTVPSRMVSLFVKGQLQDKCEFKLLGDGSLKPISYATRRTGKNGYNKSVEYDWPTKSIVYQDDSTYGFPSEYLLDNCNFYIAVALSRGAGRIATPFKVLDASEHRSRGFSIESIEHEEIKTAFGKLPAIKITINRTDSDKRRSIFWISKEYPLSPLKVRDERNGKATILTLKEIKPR